MKKILYIALLLLSVSITAQITVRKKLKITDTPNTALPSEILVKTTGDNLVKATTFSQLVALMQSNLTFTTNTNTQLSQSQVGVFATNLGFAKIGENNNFTADQTFAQDVTITGALVVNGGTFQVNSEITTTDAVLDMNSGEVGNGVTSGFSGLNINRGTSTNFAFGFDETRDSFVLGKVTDLTASNVATMQDVATRSPLGNWTSGNLAFWNASNKRFEDSGLFSSSVWHSGNFTPSNYEPSFTKYSAFNKAFGFHINGVPDGSKVIRYTYNGTRGWYESKVEADDSFHLGYYSNGWKNALHFQDNKITYAGTDGIVNELYHSGNLNKSDVDFVAKDLNLENNINFANDARIKSTGSNKILYLQNDITGETSLTWIGAGSSNHQVKIYGTLETTDNLEVKKAISGGVGGLITLTNNVDSPSGSHSNSLEMHTGLGEEDSVRMLGKASGSYGNTPDIYFQRRNNGGAWTDILKLDNDLSSKFSGPVYTPSIAIGAGTFGNRINVINDASLSLNSNGGSLYINVDVSDDIQFNNGGGNSIFAGDVAINGKITNENGVNDFMEIRRVNWAAGKKIKIIKAGTTPAILLTDENNTELFVVNAEKETSLYYNKVKKLETTNTGILITGTATASNFIIGSDKRLKTNIIPISEEEIQIDYMQFERKDDLGRIRYGVIAQELELGNPELVYTDEKGMKSVGYIDLLVREIVYLKAENKKKTAQIDAIFALLEKKQNALNLPSLGELQVSPVIEFTVPHYNITPRFNHDSYRYLGDEKGIEPSRFTKEFKEADSAFKQRLKKRAKLNYNE